MQTGTVTGQTATAISHTLLTSGNNTVNQRVYTTASVAPASNALVTIAVLGHNSTSALASPTVTGGGMSAWNEVATTTFDAVGTPHKRLTIYRALSASPGSGSITITWSASVSNCQWIVSQWSGVDATGVNGAGAIVQTGSTRGDAVNGLAVPLAPFGNANNVAYGVFGVRSSVLAVTPGPGFTEIAEQPSAESPYSDLEVEWTTNDNTVEASWITLNGGALGVEIKAGPTGPVPVAAVDVTPASASVPVGGTVQLTATPKDASGSPLSGRVVTWASSDAAVATVNESGLVTAVELGSATITATSEGQGGTATVTVVVPIAVVEVTPASASVQEGAAVQLTATLKDAAGNILSGRVVTWSSDTAAVATVDGNGLVTGVRAGSVTITAMSEGKSGSAAVTVTPVPVASVEVSPATGTVAVGGTLQFRATPKDAGGSTLSGRVVTWAIGDGAVAMVSSSGLLTGVVAGSATITATSEGKSGTSAITVTAAPPPSAGLCLSQTGPVITLSGVITSAYSKTDLADNTKIDASTAQFVTSASKPVSISGSSNVCFHGGQTIGQLPPSTDWNTMHDTYAFQANGIPNFALENIREFNYGDGITLSDSTATDWTIRGVYFKYMRDDCVQNDWLKSGTIDDSFFDGCYEGLSSRPFTSTEDGSNNLVVVKNSLYRLQDMDQGYAEPGHGGFFKWSSTGPMVALYNNVYRLDSPSNLGTHTLSPPVGKLKDCANNVMIWLGSGPFPETLPGCYTLLTGAEGLQYWNNAVAQWKANHPNALIDVGPPIVSLYAPSGSTTLSATVTVTATAVDDQEVAGVQFKLNGQDIGPEVAAESPLTKFTLSWDSHGLPDGTYTLTATARDAAGNTKTSAGITVTLSQVAAVEVSPSVVSVGVGAAVQLTATPKDAGGNSLSGRAVTWTSNDVAVASVSGSGLVAGVGVGSATITATSEGQSGTSAITVTNVAPASYVLVGAGDIAICGNPNHEATALLLDALPGTVFTAGDNVYDTGSAEEFANCYDPSWGRHKARTRPAPGNNDYDTPGAAGYFGYFGAAAGDPTKGYYSYDLGDWHIVVLNSNIARSVGSAQEQWLRADLAASTKQCQVAIWHHPLFTTSTGRITNTSIKPLWDALYGAGVELVVNGHDHSYQRYAPQTPNGVLDPAGIRQITAGTGGRSLYGFGPEASNVEVRNNVTHGVLQLTLRSGGYEWQFVPIAGQAFTDAGSGTCHGPGQPPPNQVPAARPGGPYRSEGVVAFDGGASADPDNNTPLAYAWDFGDATSGAGAAPTHTYAADGVYTVTLVVTDALGAASAPVTTTATIANIAPTVKAGPDVYLRPGEALSLSTTFSDPGVNDEPWTYAIDWGDGATESGSAATQGAPIVGGHAYAAVGQYVVRVTVTDKDGGAGSDALTATVTVIVPAAITHTPLTSGNNTVNQRVYTTAPISPAPNALITVAVMGHNSTSAPPSPTLSGGGMAAWAEVATITFDAVATPHKRLTIFRALSASPGSGTLTITWSASVSNCQWIVSQWDGVDLTGVNGAGAIGQTGSTRGDAVNGLAVPLAPFGNANNVAYGVFGVRSSVLAVTPGPGFTEIAEQPSAESPYSDLEVEWTTNDNTLDASWSTLNGGALGVEIKAGTTGP